MRFDSALATRSERPARAQDAVRLVVVKEGGRARAQGARAAPLSDYIRPVGPSRMTDGRGLRMTRGIAVASRHAPN
jgi:hypothetical protein